MSALEFHDNPDREELVTKFVNVILPLPIPNLFTYRVPFELIDQVAIGSRVIVQFGKKKILTAIIAEITEQPPEKYEAKLLLELLDDEPVVNFEQLKLFQWIADYYLCHLGEVLNAALPSGFKLSSESRVQKNPNFEPSEEPLDPLEELVLEKLEEKETLLYDEVAKIIGKKSAHPLIKKLLQKDAILLFEQIKDKFTPKKVKKIRLMPKYVDIGQIETLINELEKKPKQLDVVLSYLQDVPLFEDLELNELGLEKKQLLKPQVSPSSLNTLVKNGVFEQYDEVISRFPELSKHNPADIKFSPAQETTREELMLAFERHPYVLFRGVTGSGKTEIYIDLIQKALDNGTQVLFLLPEIALTTQIVIRLRKVFGDQMGIYHSRFSDNERVETWKGVQSGRFNLVVGVRSSVFLPFDNLGLIVVDEEHDSSYKQFEPAPRYNARDVALMLGKFQGAKVLMGSATPSTESYFNALEGRWGLVELTERFGEAKLPAVRMVENKYEGTTAHAVFSLQLTEALKERLHKKEQAIIFQNRRGYSPFVLCNDCSTIPMCDNCNVSLTYHMYTDELRCHYCGYTQHVPTNCEACGSMNIKTVGHGTEKIEDELQLLVPDARIARMDYDTTRKKNAYEIMLSEFASRNTDILVGTQMISKGLDFDNVTLVGIFDADRMMSYPDYRSHERAFQLLTQVAGRAGRSQAAGEVIIQTNNPGHPLLELVKTHDFLTFYHREIHERRKYHYPPFTRLIRITVKHKDRTVSNRAAEQLAKLLAVPFTKARVLGPEEPIVNRIRNIYLTNVLLKLDRQHTNFKASKFKILDLIAHLHTRKDFKGSYFVLDVDPM